MSNLYQKNSIESLSPLEFVRLKPEMYAGNTEYSTQLLIEVVSNAIDEYKLGHCKTINVTIADDGEIKVKDDGQGFLINEVRPDGKTILEAAFSVFNTSGKYNSDGIYGGNSLGTYGLGAKLCTFLSEYLEVISVRDGQTERLLFKEGVLQKRELRPSTNVQHHGTIVRWKPDKQFFQHIEVDIDKIKNLFKATVCLCPGLTITLNKEIYNSKNGIEGFLNDTVKQKEIIGGDRFVFHFKHEKNEMDAVLTYTSAYDSTIVPYVNTGLTEGGAHLTQIKTILTREMNQIFRKKGYLKEKDENLSGDDLQEGMYFVFNITTTNVTYDAQIKGRVVSLDSRIPFQAFIEAFRNWLENSDKACKIIAEKALKARKAREAARKAKDNVRGLTTKIKGLKAKMALSDKFVDCVSKDPKQRCLHLVEGNSAAGSVIEARNVEIDCVYMLRGKIISPLKTSIEKILANQEMSDLIRIIGAGFGDSFDVKKMNVDKVIITSDSDEDGAQIELLLITFFYTYMEPLILAGKLYRAVTPLYIVNTKKDKFYFFSDKELKEWESQNQIAHDVVYAKGLGSISAAQLKEICFEKQRYKRITVSDAEKTKELLNILEGSSIPPRKQFIYDNATKLGFNFI